MISERLHTLRKEKNMSKRELVSMLPLNYSTYANYESGFREPNSDVLQILAKHFNVSIDYLLGVSDNRKKADDVAVLNDTEHELIIKYRQMDNHGREMIDLIMEKELERISFLSNKQLQEQKTDDRWVMLPVYPQKASISLGKYLEMEKECEHMRFVATPVSKNADFCVMIKGDSMEPKIYNNDIVFIKSTPKIDPDSIGFFIYENEAYFKRLRVDHRKGRIFLESLNKMFASKEITKPENLQTIGLVIGIAERKEI